jgi:hypothetical protein
MAVEEVFHFTMEVIFPAVWGGRPRPPPFILVFQLLRHHRASGMLAPTFEAPPGIMIAAHE